MWSGIMAVTTFIVTCLSIGSQCVYRLRMNASLCLFRSWPGKVSDALGASGLAWGVYDLFDSLGAAYYVLPSAYVCLVIE
jgi:hypothetical protein